MTDADSAVVRVECDDQRGDEDESRRSSQRWRIWKGSARATHAVRISYLQCRFRGAHIDFASYEVSAVFFFFLHATHPHEASWRSCAQFAHVFTQFGFHVVMPRTTRIEPALQCSAP